MSWWNDDDESEADAQILEEDFKTPIDRIIFLIDARAAMFTPNNNDELSFVNCVRVATEVMKSKIISSDKAEVGVIFFGTRECTPDDNNAKQQVYQFFPLAIVTADRIRQLQNMLDNMQTFHSSIGSMNEQASHECPIRDALLACSFGENKSKVVDFKRIWIFTNDDNPNALNQSVQNATVKVANDCLMAKKEISLFHLNRQGQIFDPHKFYIKLLLGTNEPRSSDVEEIGRHMLGAGANGFDQLLAIVRKKEFRQRVLCRTLFNLDTTGTYSAADGDNENSKIDESAPQLMIGIQIYSLLQIMKRPAHKWLYAETNEPVTVVTKLIDGETGASVSEDQIETFLEVGSTKVFMTKQELTSLKQFNNRESVGIQLLCFAPASFLPAELNIDEPYFLYPDEMTVKNSNLLFEALLRDLASKKLMALVRFNRTYKTTARLGVLLPQLEGLDEDGCQILPSGLHLLPMPFADEVRFDPVPAAQMNCSQLDPNVIVGCSEAFMKIIQSLQMPPDFVYHQHMESPAIQNYYSVLQAVALGQERLDWQAALHDRLVPVDRAALVEPSLRNNAQVIVELSQLQAEVVGGKRKASCTADNADKKVKKETIDMTAADVQLLVQEGKIGKLTVDQLKQICKTINVSVQGKKQDLLERINSQYN